MTREEKALVRIFFQKQIHEADGQKFEDIFNKIMRYYDVDFQSIKPWGPIGDRKNDGYIKTQGKFYQVFAPENIEQSYPAVIKKIKTDFNGLKAQWNPINEFHFVVNDKYKGVNPDSEQLLEQIKIDNNLNASSIMTPKDLENYLFTLTDDEIISIVGYFPDPSSLAVLNYSILNEVIDHLQSIPIRDFSENITVPNWRDKIKFNELYIKDGDAYKPSRASMALDSGILQLSELDSYLKNNSDFLSEELQKKLQQTYQELLLKYSGIELFWEIVKRISPSNDSTYYAHVLTIMSKYFETCDIFEEPK
ncbi:MAG TPA: hypothetical protein EYG85_02505 [Crocinitomix sp.]|nr:hypothetical protein [Crocinitomix sp.]